MEHRSSDTECASKMLDAFLARLASSIKSQQYIAATFSNSTHKKIHHTHPSAISHSGNYQRGAAISGWPYGITYYKLGNFVHSPNRRTAEMQVPDVLESSVMHNGVLFFLSELSLNMKVVGNRSEVTLGKESDRGWNRTNNLRLYTPGPGALNH